jgi:hypothetical protein
MENHEWSIQGDIRNMALTSRANSSFVAPTVATGGTLILTPPPCIFYSQFSIQNIQGGVRMTSPPMAGGTRAADDAALGPGVARIVEVHARAVRADGVPRRGP